MPRVLNHGEIYLIQSMGSDAMISRSARVVDPLDADARGMGQDEKLICYMLTNGHTSPFEHVVFHFWIKAPIFVFRQWHRHRTWSFNEISGRYRELEPQFYLPDPAMIGKQNKKNHQSRDIVELTGEELDIYIMDVEHARRDMESSFYRYEQLLKSGWPRELARIVLPVATYSEMTATVNLHNLLKFLEQRMDAHAQWEIQEYARAIWTLIYNTVPLTCDIWRELHPSLEYPK